MRNDRHSEDRPVTFSMYHVDDCERDFWAANKSTNAIDQPGVRSPTSYHIS